MPMTLLDTEQLKNDIARMAEQVTDDIGNAKTTALLKNAAKPIHETMVANATKGGTYPKRITGALVQSLKIGNVKKSTRRGKYVTIGSHRKDWNIKDYYPVYVEYGHGGPAPAPAHPYIRPAYDTQVDAAYSVIRDGLADLLKL